MNRKRSHYWIWVLALLAVLISLIVVGYLIRTADLGRHQRSEEHLQNPAATEEPSAEPSAEAETAAPTPAPEEDPAVSEGLERVQSAFDSFLNSSAGNWSLYFESLGAHSYSWEASRGIGAEGAVSASVIKLFIMAAVYQEIEAGTIAHDTAYPLISGMITVSDNDAANRLVRMLGNGDAAAGMEKVNAYARSIGCEKTRQNRLMLDFNGAENYVTASDCGRILRLIYDGRCVSKTWSSEMLDVLKAQTVNNRIPALLPPEAVVAHKTGDLSNLSCGDAAIVFTPYGDYILCIISNDSPNDAQTITDIANLSAIIYHQFTGTS